MVYLGMTGIFNYLWHMWCLFLRHLLLLSLLSKNLPAALTNYFYCKCSQSIFCANIAFLWYQYFMVRGFDYFLTYSNSTFCQILQLFTINKYTHIYKSSGNLHFSFQKIWILKLSVHTYLYSYKNQNWNQSSPHGSIMQCAVVFNLQF